MIRDLFMVELHVSDWIRSVRWYREVLGLRSILQVEADEFSLFQLGNGRLALKPGIPGGSGVLLTIEVDDLDAMLARLLGLGVRLVKPVGDSREGYRRAIIADPDGYQLCLFDWQSMHAKGVENQPAE